MPPVQAKRDCANRDRRYHGPVEAWSFDGEAWTAGEKAGATLRWFSLCGSDQDDLEELAKRFGLHPLAVEDCLSPRTHAPKIDEFSDHLFLVLLAAQPGSEAPGLEEIDVFLGHDFVITYSDHRETEIEAVLQLLRSGRGIRPGADGVVYEIADRLTDAFLPEVHGIADQLDAIEANILANPSDRMHSFHIVALRSHAGQIRRFLGPQLNVMQRLSRGEFAYVSEANRIYFRDIYDHHVRLDIALEGVRDDAEVALSTYLSAVNNRMSEIVKVLSLVAALALPGTVISGIFGTNFDNVPGLHNSWGFVVMMVGMGGVAGGMLLYFWRKGWL